jgi:hypothetical protein
VTAVASRLEVVEIEPQVRTLLDRDLVVGMEVPVTASECTPQFIQYMLRWWKPQSDLAEESDDLRLPSAIHAPPAIALEAQNPQPAMAGVVAALDARAAAFVVFPLSGAAVGFAGTAGSECGTARGRARTQYPAHLTGLLVGYHAQPGDQTLERPDLDGLGHRVMLRVDRGFSLHLLELWLYSISTTFASPIIRHVSSSAKCCNI